MAKVKNNQTGFVLKSGSSNISANQIKFIEALRILVLPVVLNDVYFQKFRRVHHSLTNW